MEPLKEIFNYAFVDELAYHLKKSYPQFDIKQFKQNCITEDYSLLSLNERMRRITKTMQLFLPDDFKKSLPVLYEVIPKIKKGYPSIIFPEFVGLYGKNNFELSLKALRNFTSYGTSEFAIREFLKHDFQKTIFTMQKWSVDKNHHVRRLASEGSRPRLPWSFKLDEVIQNPFSTEIILNQLKADKEIYVKKSVANHLNDISKDNTDAFFSIINKWEKVDENTNWIIKHAGRNLIKNGNSAMLKLVGVKSAAFISGLNFELKSKKIKLGNYLNFEINFKSDKQQQLIIDYAVYYLKKNGIHSKKVFKLKTFEVEKGQFVKLIKTQLFKDFSTRKHNHGEHKIALLINGLTLAEERFFLTI